MINSLFHHKKTKRNVEDSEDIHPVLKKIRIWNYKQEIEHANSEREYIPLFPIESSFSVANKKEELMCDSTVMDNKLIKCSNNITSNMSQNTVAPLIEVYRSHSPEYKYTPDLNAAENPHYYEYNKLLFELYVERMQRSVPESSQ